MAERINYKELCQRPFEMDAPEEINFKMLVYTGEKVDERPVFKIVRATDACKIRIGSAGKEFWGIIGYDPMTEESQWYNYNDCVSMENWAVLDRMLNVRFGWMKMLDSGLVYETKIQAKSQLMDDK